MLLSTPWLKWIIITVFKHYLEELLNEPAMVLFQGNLIGFGGIDPDQVGVVLIFFPIHQALEEDLDEPETPSGKK